MNRSGKFLQSVQVFWERRGFCSRPVTARVGAAATAVSKPRTFRHYALNVTRARVNIFEKVLAGLIIVIQPNCVFATEVSDSLDLVEFFKRTVASPPDVEHFIATQQILNGGAISAQAQEHMKSRGLDPNATTSIIPHHFSGAFAGSNFFVLLGDTNSGNASGLAYGKQPILGRAGTNTYEVGVKTLTRTFEDVNSHRANPVARMSAAQYRLVSQLLRMGVGEVRFGTVTWRNNDFLAESGSGVPIYGKLMVSNNLPSRLELGKAETFEAYTVLTYEYPTPASSLGGYPRAIIRMKKHNDKWEAASQFIIKKMGLAKTQLPEEFFSETRFLTTNHVFQTLFSNGAYYASHPDGRTKRFVDFGEKGIKAKSTLVRRSIVAILCTMTLAFLFFLARSWKSKKQT